MATDPWNGTEIGPNQKPLPLYLQGIHHRSLGTQLISHCGQHAMTTHHWLLGYRMCGWGGDWGRLRDNGHTHLSCVIQKKTACPISVLSVTWTKALLPYKGSLLVT